MTDLAGKITPLLRYVHPKSFSTCTEEELSAAGKDLTLYALSQGLPTHWDLVLEHQLEDGQWEWILEPVDARWVPLDGEADPGLGEPKHEYVIETEVRMTFQVTARASDPMRIYRWFTDKLVRQQAGIHLVAADTNFIVISTDGQPGVPVPESNEEPS